MKRILLILLAFLMLNLTGCTQAVPPEESTAGAATEIISGWVQREEGMFYLGEDGLPLTGWQTIEQERYCFTAHGVMLAGWYHDGGMHYYLDDSGKMVTGWQEIERKRYYFNEDGTMHTGWLEQDGASYFFGMDGVMYMGFLNVEDKVYHFGTDGVMHTGWLELKGDRYYFSDQGVMAVGPTQIEGKQYYFTPRGIHMYLVNPWNPIPEDYEPQLIQMTYRDRIAVECATALRRMLEDCAAAGFEPTIISAYRTHDEQVFLFERKVKVYTDAKWSRAEAERMAAVEVAVPGTSEHQLGLAVDIIGSEYPYLDEYQAETPSQKWLMEHCHEYGFILRYPVGTTEITGIVFEPWHYRYVGEEIAREIMELGITLEEYLGAA